MMRAQGMSSDRNIRCELLENMLVSKIFLMQSRIDSLKVNQDMVESELSNRIAQVKTSLGGEKEMEAYFGKSLYKIRQEWRKNIEEQSLTQQMQGKVSQNIPEVTPLDVKQMLDTMDKADLPVVPVKYKLSQICIYPDREAANMACKERLLALRERIIAGESFSMLARLYSKDPGSARKGGELGMASKSIFWPVFSDAAMSLKPGIVSQIVETPDGFHIIQVIEKKGDMFNARHILLKPEYTSEDREKAIAPFIAAAKEARRCGLGLNAGHDLSLQNLEYYKEQIPWTDEVSIGHALICDALYLGLEIINTYHIKWKN